MKFSPLNIFNYYFQVIKEFDRNIKLLFISHFLWFMGAGLYMSLWPIYLKTLGADAKTIGFITSLTFMIATLTYLPGGILGDLFSKKKIMIFGWLLAAPSALVFALASSWQMIIPGIFIYFLSFICIPSQDAYIANYSPEKKVHFSYTFVYVVGSSSLIFSPVIGGLIAQFYGIRTVFFVSFLLFLLSSVALFFLSSEKKLIKSKTIAKNRVIFKLPELSFINPILKYIIGFSLLILLLYPVNPFINIFLQEYQKISLLQIGLLGSITGIGSFLFTFVVEKFQKDKNGILAIAILMVVMALSLLIFSGHFFYTLLAMFLLGATRSLEPLMKGVVATFLEEKDRAKGMGIFNTALGIAAMLAPLIGGWLYYINPYALFALAISWGLLGIVVFRIYRSKAKEAIHLGIEYMQDIIAKTLRKS